jgi:thioredoxin:protein disulfide reductase
MLIDQAPIVALVASFGAGLVASLTPSVYARVPSSIAVFGAGAETPRWRRALLAATFAVGLAALCAPIGLFARGSGTAIGGWLLWQPFAVGAIALLFTALAATMFGVFEVNVPSGLGRKLSAVGGPGFRGAFAMGLVSGFLCAPTTLPFVVALAVVVATSTNAPAWLGAVVLASFGLGLGTLTVVAATARAKLPASGPWLRGSKWVGGVGLGCLAFAELREGFRPIHDAVKDPHYEPGLLAGTVFLVGIAFAVVHLVAERSGSSIAPLSKAMWIASIVPAVVGCALFFSWLPHPHGNAPAITFTSDEAHGRAVARAQNRPVIIVFNASWCCREVERDMFPDPRVREEARRFVSIAIDATDDDEPDTQRLQQKYKVVGLPTIIMLDSEGREISRINDMVDPRVLVAELKKVP